MFYSTYKKKQTRLAKYVVLAQNQRNCDSVQNLVERYYKKQQEKQTQLHSFSANMKLQREGKRAAVSKPRNVRLRTYTGDGSDSVAAPTDGRLTAVRSSSDFIRRSLGPTKIFGGSARFFVSVASGKGNHYDEPSTKFQGVRTKFQVTKYCAPKQFSTCQIFTTYNNTTTEVVQLQLATFTNYSTQTLARKW